MTTKEKIFNCTVDLVQNRGFESVTLREVSRESKQNIASISYHLGDKDGLFQAINDRYYTNIAKHWEHLLQSLESAYGSTLTPKHLIRSFIEPFVNTKYSGFSRKLGRTMFAKSLMSRCLSEDRGDLFQQALTKYANALTLSIPTLSNEEALRIFRLSAGAAITYISTESYGNSIHALDDEADPMVNIEFEFVCSYCCAFVEELISK